MIWYTHFSCLEMHTDKRTNCTLLGPVDCDSFYKWIPLNRWPGAISSEVFHFIYCAFSVNVDHIIHCLLRSSSEWQSWCRSVSVAEASPRHKSTGACLARWCVRVRQEIYCKRHINYRYDLRLCDLWWVNASVTLTYYNIIFTSVYVTYRTCQSVTEVFDQVAPIQHTTRGRLNGGTYKFHSLWTSGL